MQAQTSETVVVPDGRGLRVGVVVSRFNAAVTSRLATGAGEALRTAGVLPHAIERVDVPGAFELPIAARVLASAGRVDTIVCLGCVIRGETPHFDYISSAVAHGIMTASLASGVPMAFGVLTTDTPEQADARSQPGATNKGFEAACAAIEMARLRQRVLGLDAAAPRVG
jgi:6,7-dimethyl-8-ribityllumazine synthase